MRMVRWLRWHCPPDTGFEIRALAVWGRARYPSVTKAPHNTNFHTWMGKKHFCFFQTAETGNRTPYSGVEGSGANHYPRAPAPNDGNSWKSKKVIKVAFKTNIFFNSTILVASFLPVGPNSKKKEETNREKYVFHCSVSQIHINPEKKTRKKYQNHFLWCTYLWLASLTLKSGRRWRMGQSES